MVSMKRSPSSDPNPNLREEQPRPDENNRQWLERHGDADGVILLGGTSLADFRVRVAQSALRHDMLPSHWSLCGILLKGGVFASVPFNFSDGVSMIPKSNAVKMCSLDDYADTQRFPNIAAIRFAKTHDKCHGDIERVRTDRSLIDLPALMLPWLGFIWGTAGSTNPLTSGTGLPSAAFVETVFAMAGFELTPGLSSASSCPEAIWQSAKWWAGYYESMAEASAAPDATTMIPQGVYTIRQTAAAAVSD